MWRYVNPRYCELLDEKLGKIKSKTYHNLTNTSVLFNAKKV